MSEAGLTDDELDVIDERVSACTPGPWHVRSLDDDYAMVLIAISTKPDRGLSEMWPNFDCGEMVAATLVQRPRYVDAEDGLWDENAWFIANARTDVPRLIKEIRRLRQQLPIDLLSGWLDTDEPMVEAIGNTLAEFRRCDSQEQARRVLGTVIRVLEEWRDNPSPDSQA